MPISLDQVKQADGHLVTVRVVYPWSGGGTAEARLVGILENVVVIDNDNAQFSVTTGYNPGAYDLGEESTGSRVGMQGISLDEVVEFDDHGDRSDFAFRVQHLMSHREQCLNALKAAEADLQRAYATVTNLTAQEG